MSKAKNYDENCLDLALYFVEDVDDADGLAQQIQDTIEAWFSDRDNRNEAAWERDQEALREGGGPDDSAYRRDLIAAGRGHLLKD